MQGLGSCLSWVLTRLGNHLLFCQMGLLEVLTSPPLDPSKLNSKKGSKAVRFPKASGTLLWELPGPGAKFTPRLSSRPRGTVT